jgi:hypothetical protein
MQSPPSLKRERFEDPLDLSSSQPNSKRIKEESEPVETGLSGHQDPESWSVERVAAFVENIETCQEYAEVSSCKLQSFKIIYAIRLENFLFGYRNVSENIL